jgi:hypothetical protein
MTARFADAVEAAFRAGDEGCSAPPSLRRRGARDRRPWRRGRRAWPWMGRCPSPRRGSSRSRRWTGPSSWRTSSPTSPSGRRRGVWETIPTGRTSRRMRLSTTTLAHLVGWSIPASGVSQLGARHLSAEALSLRWPERDRPPVWRTAGGSVRRDVLARPSEEGGGATAPPEPDEGWRRDPRSGRGRRTAGPAGRWNRPGAPRTRRRTPADGEHAERALAAHGPVHAAVEGETREGSRPRAPALPRRRNGEGWLDRGRALVEPTPRAAEPPQTRRGSSARDASTAATSSR